MTAMLCAAPDATGSQRCGAPGPTAPLVVGADGTGRPSSSSRRGRSVLSASRVAVTRPAASRSRRRTSSHARRSSRSRSRRRAAPSTTCTRVALGLALAILLILLAIWLLRRTDWSAGRRSRGAGDRRRRVRRPRRDHRRAPARRRCRARSGPAEHGRSQILLPRVSPARRAPVRLCRCETTDGSDSAMDGRASSRSRGCARSTGDGRAARSRSTGST